MEINVKIPVRSNFARRPDRNINFAPERVHIFPYQTNNLLLHNYYAFQLQKIKNIIQNESKPIVATVSKAVTSVY